MYRKILSLLVSCILALLSSNSFARTYTLTLIDKDRHIEIPLSEVRQQANVEFKLYEPFERKEVKIKGIFLDELLEKYLSHVPEDITLYAIDGYETKFSSWKKKHWVIVAYQDGKPLSIRAKGPLKVVEKDIGNKDPLNLRAFNKWVWMLNKIEVKE